VHFHPGRSCGHPVHHGRGRAGSRPQRGFRHQLNPRHRRRWKQRVGTGQLAELDPHAPRGQAALELGIKPAQVLGVTDALPAAEHPARGVEPHGGESAVGRLRACRRAQMAHRKIVVEHRRATATLHRQVVCGLALQRLRWNLHEHALLRRLDLHQGKRPQLIERAPVRRIARRTRRAPQLQGGKRSRIQLDPALVIEPERGASRRLPIDDHAHVGGARRKAWAVAEYVRQCGVQTPPAQCFAVEHACGAVLRCSGLGRLGRQAAQRRQHTGTARRAGTSGPVHCRGAR